MIEMIRTMRAQRTHTAVESPLRTSTFREFLGGVKRIPEETFFRFLDECSLSVVVLLPFLFPVYMAFAVTIGLLTVATMPLLYLCWYLFFSSPEAKRAMLLNHHKSALRWHQANAEYHAAQIRRLQEQNREDQFWTGEAH